MDFTYEAMLDSSIEVTLDGRQGNVRKHMEDAAVVGTFGANGQRFHAFIILDGHGGITTVQFAKEHILEQLVSQLSAPKATVPKAIEKTFKKVNDDLAAMKKSHTSGSTASLLLIRDEPRDIWVANVGDSSVVGLTDTSANRLTPEHNVSLKKEKERIQKHEMKVCSQGYIYNDQGMGLAVTRALGDFEMGKGVLSTPAIRHVSGKFTTFVLASDGLWDLVKPRALIELIKKYPSASALNDYRMKTFDQHDNTTIMVVRFLEPKNSQPKDSTNGLLMVRKFPHQM